MVIATLMQCRDLYEQDIHQAFQIKYPKYWAAQ